MAVFAQAEQHQVEFARAGEGLRVRRGGRLGPVFRRERMNLAARNRHVVQPGLRRQAAVAFRMLGRQAALVAEINMPGGPIGPGFAQ